MVKLRTAGTTRWRSGDKTAAIDRISAHSQRKSTTRRCTGCTKARCRSRRRTRGKPGAAVGFAAGGGIDVVAAEDQRHDVADVVFPVREGFGVIEEVIADPHCVAGEPIAFDIPVTAAPGVVVDPAGKDLSGHVGAGGVAGLDDEAVVAGVADGDEGVEELGDQCGGAGELVGPGGVLGAHVAVPGGHLRVGEVAFLAKTSPQCLAASR